MKSSDLRGLTAEELDARVREARAALFDKKVKHATGQLEDTAALRRARKDLARAATIQRERSRAS